MTDKIRSSKKPKAELAATLEEALGHPLRAWCLAKLNESPASAAELARRSGERRNNVNYHFSVLERLGCIELVEERPVRGTYAKIYRGTKKVVLDYEAWENLSLQARTGISLKAFAETVERAEQALEGGTFEERLDRVIANYKLSLDEKGWSKAVGILRNAHKRLETLEPESVNRTTDPSERTRFTFSLLGYESPQRGK